MGADRAGLSSVVRLCAGAMEPGARYERHTPFGADKGIFSANPLGNEGLGERGYQQQMQRRPFNEEVLALRSNASSVAGERRGEGGALQRGAREVVAGDRRNRPDGRHPSGRVDEIMRSAQYPAEAERQHFGKQQYAEGHQPGSKAGELMMQTPALSNAGSAAGVQVTGWGPTTRILPGDDGGALPTNRSTAALQEKNVPLNPVSILYRGGLYGADRGLRVDYRDAEVPVHARPPPARTRRCAEGMRRPLTLRAHPPPQAPTGHSAAPYLQPPANPRADADVEGT